MHKDHGVPDHRHSHHGHDDDANPGQRNHARHGPGHNAPRRAAQWQTPHDPGAAPPPHSKAEADFDLVEAAFAAGFSNAPDPVSFLRLARVPFEGKTAEGHVLQLLRVELDHAVDLASLTPHLGGGSMRYAPLPARLTSKRLRLSFAYFDGEGTRRLSFAEALALA